MKFKEEIDRILALVENQDKDGLRDLDLLNKSEEFWLEMISISPKARAWVARRRYLSQAVYLKLCEYSEKELLICLAANKNAPAETHVSIAKFGGEPLRILLEIEKRLDESILVQAKKDADSYIVALAKTRLSEPLDLDLMNRVIFEYGPSFLHKFLTEPKLFRGFTTPALERVRQLNDAQLNEYVKWHE